MKSTTTKDLAIATIRAMRVLDQGSLQVLARKGAGAKMFLLLHPYMDEALSKELSSALGMPDAAITRSDVEEYFVAHRKLLDAEFAKLHAEQDRLRATQRETREMIQAARDFTKVVGRACTPETMAYWGNLK